MKPGIHYVVVAYLGRRRIEYPPQVADRLLFLRQHFAQLATVKHELAKITVVLQFDRTTRIWDDRVREVVPKQVGGTPVELVLRPNDRGLSYAALAAVIDHDYEFTIFNEDDYLFTVDGFDRWLADKMTANPEVSLLCAGVMPYVDAECHAGVSTGIVRSKHITQRDIPELTNPDYIPQVMWSRLLMKHGPIVDWLHWYATAFRMDSNAIRWLERGRADKVGTWDDGTHIFLIEPLEWRQAFVVPVQTLSAIGEISYWSGSLQAWTSAHGHVGGNGTLVWA